jgi:murein DD-endopeptidase MepM/ murein hydrolase activator NlpD
MIFDNKLIQNISKSFTKISKNVGKTDINPAVTKNNQNVAFVDPLGGKGVITSELKRASGRFHGGIDIGATKGSEVLATADGVVLDVDFHKGGFGHVVVIQHSNGLQSSYAHLDKPPSVKKGQSVKQGQTIGQVGTTGNSTGYHLDFRVGKKLWNNGAWNYAEDAQVIDPQKIIKFTQPKK